MDFFCLIWEIFVDLSAVFWLIKLILNVITII